ncbi:MAG: HAD-IA family hydrolase [Synergistaceae bacterium]|nr:HAD-IA family hydrolase [Synergistaceae bacterium]
MITINNIKAVLFDFDMTLVDSSYAIHHCTNLLAGHLGFSPISREKVLSAIGLTIEDSWRMFWGDFRQEWVDFYRANYREEEQARLKFFQNTLSTLEKLRMNGIKVGVVSNRRFAKRPVEFMGLTPMLDVVVGLEDVERPKPEPDSLLKGFELLRVSPPEGVYVGDTDIDMMTALAAGCRGIGMTTGNFDKKSLLKAGACEAMDDLGEILLLFAE